MKNIYFRRLFFLLTQEHQVLTEEETKKKGYTVEYAVENVIVQYRYRLRVDLWLVVFDFTWDGRDRSAHN